MLIPIASTRPLKYGNRYFRKSLESLHRLTKQTQLPLHNEHDGSRVGFVDRLKVVSERGFHYLVGHVNSDQPQKRGYSLQYAARRTGNQLNITRAIHVAMTDNPRDISCQFSDSGFGSVLYQDSTESTESTEPETETKTEPTIEANPVPLETETETPTQTEAEPTETETETETESTELEETEAELVVRQLVEKLTSDSKILDQLRSILNPTEPESETKPKPKSETRPKPTQPAPVRETPQPVRTKPIQQPFPSR